MTDPEEKEEGRGGVSTEESSDRSFSDSDGIEGNFGGDLSKFSCSIQVVLDHVNRCLVGS